MTIWRSPMKKHIITIFLLFSSFGYASASNYTPCEAQLENAALAAFDAQEDLRDSYFMTSAKVIDMSMKPIEVHVYQYKATYQVFIQIENGDLNKCMIEDLSDFTELR